MDENGASGRGVVAEERRFSITVDEDRRLVEVIYTGEVDLHERAAAVKAASEVLEEKGYRRVLVDLSNARMKANSPHEESWFANVLGRNPVLARSRTAYLARPDQTVNWFIGILAQARHYACKHCNDREAAYAWLMDSEGG